MVKLKKENQLDLFSWIPKERNIEPSSSDNKVKLGSDIEKEIYDGLDDKDQNKWFNTTYLKKKYGDYNNRFLIICYLIYLYIQVEREARL